MPGYSVEKNSFFVTGCSDGKIGLSNMDKALSKIQVQKLSKALHFRFEKEVATSWLVPKLACLRNGFPSGLKKSRREKDLHRVHGPKLASCLFFHVIRPHP